MHILFSKLQSKIPISFRRSERTKTDSRNLIGTGKFGTHEYFFIRDKAKVFLVGKTTTHVYRKRIVFSNSLSRYIPSMKDLDAIELASNRFALVCTIKVGDEYKTVYLESPDTTHWQTWSMVRNPNACATKIVRNDDEIILVTSVDGEICYRKLDTSQRRIEYYPTTLRPRNNSFDHSPLRVVGAFTIEDGIFVVYDSSYEMRGCVTHRFGAALLSSRNLSHVHWREQFDEVPFWDLFVSKKECERVPKPIGANLKGDTIRIYFYEAITQDIYSLDLHQPYARRDPHPDKAKLRKHITNPILSAQSQHSWESRNVFNPAAIQIDNITHLLYRAEGEAGLSVIGYGKSDNGLSFQRYPDPIYVPRTDFEGVNLHPDQLKSLRKVDFRSGYRHYPSDKSFDWHGVEDPRITEMENRLYMIYAAFDGYHYARPAMSSILKEDFLRREWNWSQPQLMTPQAHHWGSGNKNVVLHPAKVNNQYLIYHRIWPHIRIDYVDTLEFGPGKKYLKEMDRIEVRGDSWDSNRVGVSAPPLEIDEGWLLIYQGSGSQDRRYKVGAMILDKDNPAKVLYRSSYPIMCPSEWYEGGIAYVCGAVIRDETLHVYYGGNDKYVCTATAPLKEFIEKLKQDPYQKPILKKYYNIKTLCI